MQDNLIICPYGETDADERYLAGKLPPSEAEAFERHYFECDACWARVQRGSEIKASLAGMPPVRIDSARTSDGTSGRSRLPRWTTPVAAAMAVAAVLLLSFATTLNFHTAVGATDSDKRAADTAHVMRGSERNISVFSHHDGSMWIAAWAPTPAASTYRVRLLAPDGALLYEKETADTSVVLPGDSAGSSPGNAYWEIQALNELRNVIAVSALTPTSAGARH